LKSPLSSTEEVNLIHTYSSQEIVKGYRKELGIDVSRYFLNIPEVSLFEGVDSKYRFYFPFTLEGDSTFYKLLSTSPIQYYPGWKWENEIAAQYIDDGMKIIDLGCGDGSFLADMNKRKKIEGYGIEFNPDAIQKARSKGVKVYDMRIEQADPAQNGSFDLATSFQVLEHIGDVTRFLKQKIELVKPGGLIIIGVPYNHPFLYGKDKHHVLNLPPHHMGLWNEDSLSNLERFFPIKVVSIRIQPLNDFAYYMAVQLGMAEMYKSMHRFKLLRVIFRLTDRLFSPVAKKMKGRNIVSIFRKL
jgi:2-polyprenyl-3-methyl-5-hydroxy-6-metoxy-1,4-benzoquinol methylase